MGQPKKQKLSIYIYTNLTRPSPLNSFSFGFFFAPTSNLLKFQNQNPKLKFENPSDLLNSYRAKHIRRPCPPSVSAQSHKPHRSLFRCGTIRGVILIWRSWRVIWGVIWMAIWGVLEGNFEGLGVVWRVILKVIGESSGGSFGEVIGSHLEGHLGRSSGGFRGESRGGWRPDRANTIKTM